MLIKHGLQALFHIQVLDVGVQLYIHFVDFEVSDGMITSINGIENPADWSACWMLYTDDTENSNTEWGTVEYKEKTYGSSMWGGETLKVKNGCVYIWVYQSF